MLGEELKIFVHILLVIFLLHGCFSDSSTTPDNLITGRGQFKSPKGTYDLLIGSKENSLVDYKIIRTETSEEFTPLQLFSEAMRWAFYWENDKTLWVFSSDIGTSVWKMKSDGKLSQEWVGRNPKLIESIPQELYDFLPSILRRKWNEERAIGPEPKNSADPKGRAAD